MSAASASSASLRPYLPSDAARCAAIFRASIEDATVDDYDDDQRRVWAAQADDGAAFSARLAGALSLIAVVAGQPVGFASLKGAEEIDMLYVDPDFARRGVGATLIDAVTRIAGARGAKQLTGDVSDTARLLVERPGFVAQRRNLVELDGEWLANTTMVKPLAPTGASEPSSPKLH
jgi:putative acetyltransferase